MGQHASPRRQQSFAIRDVTSCWKGGGGGWAASGPREHILPAAQDSSTCTW